METNVTILSDRKDLTGFPYDDLIGSLLSHELVMDKGKNVLQEKKKIIALKVDVEEKMNIEEEMNLIARKMKKFYKTFRKYNKDTQAKDESKKKEETEVMCYECKEPGHIRTQCTKLKKKNKDKEMIAGT